MAAETENPENSANSAKTGAKPKTSKRDRVKLNKVIIRRLPPTMTEEEFIKHIEPIPDHEFFYYVPADWSLGPEATCRAYIQFTNVEEIYLFRDRFDGYVFLDRRGTEYPAIVEFAPYQGLPRNKSRKHDPKANTIESEAHYQNFLEVLKQRENTTEKSDLKLEVTLRSQDESKMTSTPLLQYLANKKQERRDERKRKLDEKRRQREDERSKKKNQVVKNVPPAIQEEEVFEATKDKSSLKLKERELSEDSRKNSRNKRRAERDLKRKLERENRAISESKSDQNVPQGKTEKFGNRDKRNETISIIKNVTTSEKRNEVTSNKTNEGSSNNRNDVTSDQKIYVISEKKNEVKKYSQSRKIRNELKKEDKPTVEIKDEIVEEKIIGSASSDEMKESDLITGEVSDSVKDFIKSVANIKEFVPRSRNNASNVESESSIKDVNITELCEKLEKIATEGTDLNESENSKQDGEEKSKPKSDDISPESGARDSSCSGADKNEKLKESRAIRKIRNKDRPSIQIYQPGRLRLKKDDNKDGRSSAEPKDSKSNPTSDGEGSKKEKEKEVARKVSRYSERRSSRAKMRPERDDNQDSCSKSEIDTTTLPTEITPITATADEAPATTEAVLPSESIKTDLE